MRKQTAAEKKLTKKQTIDSFNSSIKRKSLIRFVSVIIDFSSAARKQEMRPNRAIVIKSYLAVIDIINIFRNLSVTFSIRTHCPNFRSSPPSASELSSSPTSLTPPTSM